MFNLGKFGATLELDSTKFDSSLSGAEKRIKGTSRGLGGFAKSVGKIAAGLGVFKLIDAGFGMIKNSIDGAISRVDTLNQFPKVLQQMGYSAEDAERSTKRLVEGIDGLPTTLDGITGDVQRMINVFHDVDLATESAIALNNAFLASGASTADAERGMDQYIKMLSTGKVDMMSWRTLQETMPYALQETAEAFGYTGRSAQNDLYDALQSGEHTMDEFNDKMIELSEGTGGFADVAIEATKGIRTSMTNIATAVVNGVASSIQAFDDWMNSKGFGGISDGLDKIKGAIGSAFGAVNTVIPKVLDVFGNLYDKVAESTAWDTLKTLVSESVDAISNLWSKFGESQVLDEVKQAFNDLLDVILEIDFMKIAQDVGSFLDTWSPLIAGITAGILAFNLITGAITLWTTVTAIATTVGTAFGAVMAFITSPIGLIVIAIGLLVAAGVALYKHWDELKDFAITIWTSIADFFSNLWEGILEAGLLIWENLKEGWTNAVENLQEAWSSTTEFFVNLWEGTVEFFAGIWESITEIGTSVWEGLKSVWNSSIEFFKNLWTGTIDFFVNLWDSIVQVFVSTYEWLDGLTDGAFSQYVSIMQSSLMAAWGIIKNIWDYVKNTFSNVLAFLKALVTGDFQGMKDAINNQMENAKNLLSNIWNTIKSNTSEKAAQILSDIIKKFTDIKTNIENKINEAKTALVKRFTDMVSDAKSKGQDIVNAVKDKFNSAKDKIIEPIEKAQEKISGIIDKIKGFFDNLKLKIPKPELPSMPTFSLKTSSKSVMGKSITYPSGFNVNWNAEGGVFKRPTIFNTANAGLQGVGEAGAEAIIPLSTKVLSDIGKGISSTMGDTNNREDIALLKKQNELLKQIADKDISMNVDGKVMAQSVSNRQGDRYNLDNFATGNR